MKLDDDIHNYYESLVTDRVAALGLHQKHDADYIADVCCLALNKVPPKYIRYEVDMAFFLPQIERIKMEKEVEDAVNEAIKTVNEWQQEERNDD